MHLEENCYNSKKIFFIRVVVLFFYFIKHLLSFSCKFSLILSICFLRPKLKAIASSASNTWGLFLLVLLFGHALVEVPRRLWNKSNHSFMLTEMYFKAAKLSSDKCEAEETVDDVLDVKRTKPIITCKFNFM